MIRRIAVMLACAALPAAAPAAAAPASPLLGRWAVDLSRLPVPPEARPRSVTLSFAARPDGQWTTQVLIVAPDGSTRAMTSAAPVDGSATVPIAGDTMEADRAALKLVADNVLVMALARNRAPASTRIYAVAPDGRHMTETAVYLGDDGKAVMRTNWFTKLP